VPEHFEGDGAGDGDRGRVQQLGDLGPGEGGADEDPPPFVDHEVSGAVIPSPLTEAAATFPGGWTKSPRHSATGQDIARRFPEVAAHLRDCAACREDIEGLRAYLQDTAERP
jgi:hypothetical protein